ncbi:MAG: class I SAM-dependent methyltransferase [Ilumatobacter sp.]|nr:class I SAM-dependent methyltransferase [Ilumatobacter sp.]
MTYHPELFETLRQAQRFGFFGDRPIDEAVAHAEHYVTAIVGRGGRLIDLGAGGGLPGLVIADARPDLEIVLLDRREKRTDFLARAARRLGFDHVDVWCRDAGDVVRDVAEERDPGFDLVTARGFGPPEVTLRMGAGCVRRPGCIVISEPPSGDRWDADLVEELGLLPHRLDAVIRFDAP